MGCSCKHNQEAINDFYRTIEEFRELFIKRMTVDSETHDRRRKDFNQAIYHYRSKEDVDEWNKFVDENPQLKCCKCEYGSSYAVFTEIDLDMILECFDNAVKDYRKTFCDVKECNRK